MSRSLVARSVLFLAIVSLAAGCADTGSSREPDWTRDRWWEIPPPTWALAKAPPRVQHFWAPDLRPRNSSTFISGQDVAITVKVQNQGNGAAGPFEVVCNVTVPGRGVTTFHHRFPDLDPTEEFQYTIGTVSIADLPRPLDLAIEVVADPPKPNLPWGEIWEWDETNNTRARAETIF